MRHCAECGARLRARQRADFERERLWCRRCRAWRCNHPQILLACFVACGNKLLWMRRRFEPRSGFWALPGGFMEAGEGLAAGAARELREETGIALSPSALSFYGAGAITFINQVYVAFRARVASEECQPGREALAAAFHSREECPWGQLAYPETSDWIRLAYDEFERARHATYQGYVTARRQRFVEIATDP